MSAAHTPGPWFVPLGTGNDGSSNQTSVWALGGSVVISESPSRSLSLEGRRANANLIAAAPNLLSLLQDAVDSFGPHLEGGDDEWLTFARAAIAKATGSRE